MDRKLNSPPLQNSAEWLTTSSHFEPYVPNSNQNVLQNLELLGSLGEMTQLSLQTPPPPALPTQAKAEAQPSTDQVQVTENSKIQDVSLLNALLELRNSKKLSFARSPGICSPILRPSHT